MEIVQSSVELLDTSEALKHVEICARVCYKTEDKIGEGTDEKLIGKIVDRKHEAMIEHYVFVMLIDRGTANGLLADRDSYFFRFLNITMIEDTDGHERNIISGSARGFKNFYKDTGNPWMFKIIDQLRYRYNVLFKDIEKFHAGNDYVKFSAHEINIDDMYLMCADKEFLTHKHISFRIICDRGVTHEIVRHRIASYAQESTRYCNYKLMGEVRIIDVATGFKLDLNDYLQHKQYDIWMRSAKQSEENYMDMLNAGASPQFARSVLINSTKTEIIMTANLFEHREFFLPLRTANTAHPQMREVAIPMNNMLADKYTVYFKKWEE